MVTVLFTDLVASTDALSRLGADQNEAVRREHFALLRDVLTKHAGREVKNLGDGFMVVFAAPSAALDAAVEMQQRLDARNRRAAEPLLMRVGISLGEVEAEDENVRRSVASISCARERPSLDSVNVPSSRFGLTMS